MLKRFFPYILTVGWGISLIALIWFVCAGRTDASLLSPWQTVSSNAAYLAGATLFFLGCLLAFSDFSSRTLLGFVSAQALAMHSYVPLSHELLYGADGWRHIASVERIMAGLPIVEAATNGGAWLSHLVGVVAYSHVWGVLLLGKMLGFSLIGVTAWFVPLAWSLVVPIVLFWLGKECGWNEKKSLALAFGSLIPFAFMGGGSFTLPNSLGFLAFLPSLPLLVRRLKTGERRLMVWLSLYGIFLLTGYTLYAVVFALLWGSAEAIRKIVAFESRGLSGFKKGLYTACLVGLVAGVIPALELAAGYSAFPSSPRFVLASAQQFVGNLTGFYLAFGPRPHAIATGNILLYQTPSYAFVPNLLTEGRYWLVLLSVFMLFFLGLALVRGLRSFNGPERWFSIVSLVFFAEYAVGRYLLTGEQILSRRMDMVLALFVIVGIVNEAGKRVQALAIFRWQRYVVVGLLFFVSMFGAAVYSLGPVDRAMSRDEYRAAEYVWSQEKNNVSGHYCVVADTYPLLALEALSAKRIVGGGFPIDRYFAQKEREEIYVLLNQKMTKDVWQEAKQATGADHCWFIGVSRNDSVAAHGFVHQFGSTTVWYSDFKK